MKKMWWWVLALCIIVAAIVHGYYTVSAQCADGSYSFSQHHQGTCSYHGGVVRWFH
jgi:hypothetical protein